MMFHHTQLHTDRSLSLQEPKREITCCEKTLLITAFVLSTLALLGGVIALFGVMGVGTMPAAIWTTLSGILIIGLVVIAIRSCRSTPRVPTQVEDLSEDLVKEAEDLSQPDSPPLDPYNQLLFDTISESELDRIFPIVKESEFNMRQIGGIRSNVATISVENIQCLIKREVWATLVKILSEEQIQSLDFQNMSDSYRNYMFHYPSDSSPIRPFILERWEWLSEDQKNQFDSVMRAKLDSAIMKNKE